VGEGEGEEERSQPSLLTTPIIAAVALISFCLGCISA
jgi:hypothetical protein